MSGLDLGSNSKVVNFPFVFQAQDAARHRSPETNPGERFGHVYGSSRAMRRVHHLIEKVAGTDATVFVIGESGSGKELVASTIHELSDRRDGPFVAVNCGAIPPNLIEAELFGHEKGSFTGATRQHKGYFERAAAGTLFLDEITEMSPDMQVRLLRVLETGCFNRVGGCEEIRAQARIIAATNRDPALAVRENRLREDLMYRLAVFPIEVPPLRAREGDAEGLARHFLQELNGEAGMAKFFSCESLSLLHTHRWPGNVRELKNCVQRAFILADDELKLEQIVPASSRAIVNSGGGLQFDVGTSLAQIEREVVFATLDHCGGNKRRTAEILGVSLKTLYNRLAEYQGARETVARAVASVG